MRPARSRTRHGPLLVVCAVITISSAAHASTSSFVDLGIGGGYSSNPLLLEDSRSSAFGRVWASGAHSWSSEVGRTSISAYVENTTYLRDYGSKQIFDLGAHTRQGVSTNVTLFGDLSFSGDFAGQLSNRFVSVPNQPPVVDPTDPLPPPTNLPDVLGFSGRQYRLNGQIGASIRSGERGTVSLSAGAQRIFFTGRGSDDRDYNVFFGSVGYSHQISPRTSAGGTVYLQRQDFNGGDDSTTINPVLTLHTQLSETISANAAAGIMYIEQSRAGEKDHEWSPSFSGSLCRTGENDNLCAHIARDAQTAFSGVANSRGAPSVSTTGSISYYRLLGEGQTLQLSLSGVRHSSIGGISDEEEFHETYLSGLVGYDRQIGHRLYAGATVGARRLFQDGPDPDIDLNAGIHLRYRLGDLQ